MPGQAFDQMPDQMPAQMPDQAVGQAAPAGKVFDDRVLELLKRDTTRAFRIDIETDSTAQPDENMEKELRTEFISAFGGFLNQVAPVVQGAPQLTPMLAEMLKFAVRGYRAGRTLEEVIEKSLDELARASGADQGPSPEEMKMQLEKERAEREAALEERKLSAEERRGAAEAQMKMEEMRLSLEMKRLEMEVRRAEHEMRMAEMQMTMEMERERAEMERERMIMEAEHSRAMRGFEMARVAMSAEDARDES